MSSFSANRAKKKSTNTNKKLYFSKCQQLKSSQRKGNEEKQELLCPSCRHVHTSSVFTALPRNATSVWPTLQPLLLIHLLSQILYGRLHQQRSLHHLWVPRSWTVIRSACSPNLSLLKGWSSAWGRQHFCLCFIKYVIKYELSGVFFTDSQFKYCICHVCLLRHFFFFPRRQMWCSVSGFSLLGFSFLFTVFLGPSSTFHLFWSSYQKTNHNGKSVSHLHLIEMKRF